MNLQVLNPAFLWGLLGVALPVMVHLLTRRQQTHIRFSAVYLLLQAQKRSIRRSQPNRLLLLLFRCLAIACLCLALANPLFSFGGPDQFLTGQPASTVFILDDSYSMSAQAAEGPLFDAARNTLESLIKRSPDSHSFSLVLASKPARVLQGWNADRNGILNTLGTLRPSYRTTQAGQALTLASELLAQAPHERKRVFLLTDLDENGWKEDELPSPNEGSFEIRILDFSSLQESPNLAGIESVSVKQEFLTNQRLGRVRFKVRNWTQNRNLDPLTASLWIGDKQAAEGTLSVIAGESTEHEFTFPHLGKETLTGFIQIAEDGLAIDNRRRFTYQPDHRIQVLLVDGDPRGVSHQNETFYLERAMNPFSSSVSDIEPSVSTLAELKQRDLFQYSVVVLSNVRELPFGYESELERFVAQGGTLWITLGDQVHPRYYNERLGALLPVELKTLNQSGLEEEPFRLNTAPSSHPVLKAFQGKTLSEMEHIRVHSYYSLEARPERPFLVAMRLTNEAPLLIESEFGKGKVLLFTSSIDRDWNNFSIQPTFLPWAQRWVKYAAQSLESISMQHLKVGEPLELDPADETRFITAPGGSLTVIQPSSEGLPAYTETDIPGTYFIHQDPGLENQKPNAPTATLPPTALPIGSFTVNIDTAESAPGKMDDTRLQDLLRGFDVSLTHDPSDVEVSQASSGASLTTPFFLLLALFFCVEGWMVRRE